MKLLFSSSDSMEVERVGKKLTAAGIGCEIRRPATESGGLAGLAYPELWVQQEEDFRTACVIFVSSSPRP